MAKRKVEPVEPLIRIGAIVDTETTGRSDGDELIELAIILFKFDATSGQVVEVIETYSGLREPGIRIDPEASHVHGLTQTDLKGMNLDDGRIREMFGRAEAIFAHYAKFDRKYIRKLFQEVGSKDWYCTLDGIPWKRLGFKSRSLHNLLAHHKIVIEQSHRALSDIDGLLRLISQKEMSTGKTYLSMVLSSGPISRQQVIKRPTAKQPPVTIKRLASKGSHKPTKKSDAWVYILMAIVLLGACSLTCLCAMRGRENLPREKEGAAQGEMFFDNLIVV